MTGRGRAAAGGDGCNENAVACAWRVKRDDWLCISHGDVPILLHRAPRNFDAKQLSGYGDS